MNLHTLGLFFVQIAVSLAALTFAGYPLAWLIRRITRVRVDSLIVVPLLGIYPIVQFAWLWSRFGSGGLGTALAVMVAVSAIISFALFFGSKDWHNRRWRPSRAWVHAPVIAAALGLVWLVATRRYFDLSYVTPVTLKNFDAPHLAMLAEHVRLYGFGGPSNIAGTTLHKYLHDDTIGTFVIDLLPATIFGQDVWRTATAVLFTAWLMLALQLRMFLLRGLRVRPNLATVGAIAGSISPLTFYVIANSYLSQLLGTALFLGGATIVLTLPKGGLRARAGHILSLGVVLGALWFVYPFTVVIFAFLVLPMRLGALHPRKWLRDLRQTIPAFLVAFVVSAILAGGRFVPGFMQSFVQGSAEAGWKLPAFTPAELLGFTSTYDSFGPNRWLGALVVVAVLGWLVRMYWHSARHRLALGAVAIGFGSYVLIYLRSGTSYQQWKWASFLAPMVTAAMLSLAVDAFRPTAKRLVAARRAWVVAVPTVVIIVFALNVLRMTNPVFTHDNKVAYVQPELASVSTSNLPERHSELGLRLNAWDSMWITSFFPKTVMHQFSFWGYYPVDPRSDGVAMLERTDDPTPPAQIDHKEPIDGLYQIVERHPRQSAQVTIRDYTHDPSPGKSVHWTVTLTNTGTSNWVSPADDPLNGISMTTTVTGAGSPIATQALPPGTVVAPGGSATFDGSTPAPSKEPFGLQFDVYQAEGGPFQTWSKGSIARINGTSSKS